MCVAVLRDLASEHLPTGHVVSVGLVKVVHLTAVRARVHPLVRHRTAEELPASVLLSVGVDRLHSTHVTLTGTLERDQLVKVVDEVGCRKKKRRQRNLQMIDCILQIKKNT